MTSHLTSAKLSTLIIAGSLLFALQLLNKSFFGDSVHSLVTQPVGERISAFLGTEPQLDSRILLVTPSPTSLDEEQTNDRPKNWIEVLQALDNSIVRRVLVFEFPDQLGLSPRVARALGPKFVFPSQLSAAPNDGSNNNRFVLGNIELGPQKGLQITTRSRELSGLLTYGHLDDWSPLSVIPGLKTDQGGEHSWSKHLALQSGQPIRFLPNKIDFRDSSIPWHLGSPLPLRRTSPDWITDNLFGFSDVLRKASNFYRSANKDSIVLIQSRPLQAKSAGLLPELSRSAQIASRHLQQQWIQVFPFSGTYVSGVAAALLLVSFLFSSRVLLLFATLLTTLHLIGGPLLFASRETLAPWFEVCFFVAPAFIVAAAIGSIRTYIQHSILRSQFSGIIPETQAEELATSIEGTTTTTHESVLTLLDLDFVGFAKTIDNIEPNETAQQLSALLNRVVEKIQEHKGLICEISADGVLAAFGSQLFGEASLPIRHFEKALNCARELQIQTLSQIQASAATSLPPFPVRVALNTCTVRLSILNIKGKMEIRAIGSGVDLVKRLAAQCEAFRILASESSIELAREESSVDYERFSHARYVKREDRSGWLACFEFNPFADNPKATESATEIFRLYNAIKREDNRYIFERENRPIFNSEAGHLEILDFSHSGLRLRATNYLSVGSELRIWPGEFDESSTPIRAKATVQWGSPCKEGTRAFTLGMRFTDNTPEEMKKLQIYLYRRLNREEHSEAS